MLSVHKSDDEVVGEEEEKVRGQILFSSQRKEKLSLALILVSFIQGRRKLIKEKAPTGLLFLICKQKCVVVMQEIIP